MKKFIISLLVMVAVFVSGSVQAGDAAYRILLPFAGSSNVSYTVGRYEKPRITAVETVGINAGTNVFFVTYGDAAGGTRTFCTMTNAATTAGSNGVTTFTIPQPDLAYGDVLTFGNSSTTNGYVRISVINRDTKPNN